MNRVHDVVVQHHVFKVCERGYLLLLVELINYFLVLGQHVVLNNLFTQQVYDLVIIDTMSWTVELCVLRKPEASFEG